ncbi:MAG: hypothetical protein ACREJ5_03625 [Geminicoccaceae bacterium]
MPGKTAVFLHSVRPLPNDLPDAPHVLIVDPVKWHGGGRTSSGGQITMGTLKAFQPAKRLRKKARRGFRGYPAATIAFYGPDDRRASKVAVGILLGADQEAAELRRWTSAAKDLRDDPEIGAAVLDFIARFEVKTVAMTDRIIGCPHEEGIDDEGPICPSCPFWADRDRWTGEIRP